MTLAAMIGQITRGAVGEGNRGNRGWHRHEQHPLTAPVVDAALARQDDADEQRRLGRPAPATHPRMMAGTYFSG